MISKILCIILVGLTASVAFAAEGQLKPIAIRDKTMIYFSPFGSSDFHKADADSGTIHPGAVVAKLEGGTGVIVAVDATDPNASAPDVLRLDFTGKGRFENAPTVPMKYQSMQKNYVIGPATVQVELDGKTVPVLISGNYTKVESNPAYRYIALRMDTGLEGPCNFGGKVHQVRIINNNADLRVGDLFKVKVQGGKIVGFEMGDALAIDIGDGTFKGKNKVLRLPFGSPALVDGAWWDVKLNADHTAITATKVDLPVGKIKINHPSWEMVLAGDKGVFKLLSGKDGQPLEVPAGEYIIPRFKEFAPDANDKGTAILIETNENEKFTGKEPTVAIPAGGVAELTIGSPLVVKVKAKKSGESEYILTLVCTDSSGTEPSYVRTKEGQYPPATIHIKDAGGNEIYKAKMEYGRGGLQLHTWSVPDNLKGTVTVEVEYDTRPFEVKAVPATINVE